MRPHCDAANDLDRRDAAMLATLYMLALRRSGEAALAGSCSRRAPSYLLIGHRLSRPRRFSIVRAITVMQQPAYIVLTNAKYISPRLVRAYSAVAIFAPVHNAHVEYEMAEAPLVSRATLRICGRYEKIRSPLKAVNNRNVTLDVSIGGAFYG